MGSVQIIITILGGINKIDFIKVHKEVEVDYKNINLIEIVDFNIGNRGVDIFSHSKNFIKVRRIFYLSLGRNRNIKLGSLIIIYIKKREIKVN